MGIENAGTVTIKGLGEVRRIGFGAMRIIGDGAWGEPEDLDVAHAVVRRAVELGVDFIDTADSYGPEVSERILADTLHPYPAGLRIGTKAGQARPRSEEHTSELQSRGHLVCRLLLEKKNRQQQHVLQQT